MKKSLRPRSIKLFVIAALASISIGFAHNLNNVEFHRQNLIGLQMGEFGDAQMVFLMATRPILLLMLVWLIWRRGNRFAKWAIVVLFFPKLWQISDAWWGLYMWGLNSILWTATTAFSVTAIALLFMKESRYWVASNGRSAQGNAAVFH